MFVTKVEGVPETLARLDRHNHAIARGVENAVKAVGLFLERESMIICPIDTGVLRGGAFSRLMSGSGFDTRVEVGYMASYAVYVHENLTNYHKPPTTAKFLERPAREQVPEMQSIARRHVRNSHIRFQWNSGGSP